MAAGAWSEATEERRKTERRVGLSKILPARKALRQGRSDFKKSSRRILVKYFIGIDLGGSSIKAVMVTAAGRVLGRANVPFKLSAKMDWAEKIRALIDELESRRKSRAAAIGLAAPGLASANARSIACMPGRLQGLENLDWGRYLKRKEGVPVLNDAHAALLGEFWRGAARGYKHVFMLTLGTGVGGAVMCDGRLLRGAIGRAGHLGHISLNPRGFPDVTGMPGSLEDAMGGCTLSRRSDGRFTTTQELVVAYRGGDPAAGRIWIESVRALACAIGSLINVLDPEAVIIGGGVAGSGKALFGPLQKMVDEVEWRPGPRTHTVGIMPAQLGEYAGAFGAAFNSQNSGRR